MDDSDYARLSVDNQTNDWQTRNKGVVALKQSVYVRLRQLIIRRSNEGHPGTNANVYRASAMPKIKRAFVAILQDQPLTPLLRDDVKRYGVGATAEALARIMWARTSALFGTSGEVDESEELTY